MSTGLAREYGSPATRDKRAKLGARRFTRLVAHGAVLRPACGCDGVSIVTQYGDPLVCPSCGGARLMKNEVES